MSTDAEENCFNTPEGKMSAITKAVPFKFRFDALKEHGEIIPHGVTLLFTGSCSMHCFAKDMMTN